MYMFLRMNQGGGVLQRTFVCESEKETPKRETKIKMVTTD
jgi:hypothetical protein